MGMQVLVDTNVLLDYLLIREPYAKEAERIIKACQEQVISGSIAAHSITNIFYILRKVYTVDERKSILLDICKLFHVESIDVYKLQNALRNEKFSDFEDGLQEECAITGQVDYIVTRNVKDFESGSVPCITPDKMCEILKNV